MSDISIYEEYLDLTQCQQSKYGPRAVVLLQVGAFYEVYGFKVDNTILETTPIVEFSNACGLNITEKKTAGDKPLVYSKSSFSAHVLMSGFRDYTLDKYLQRLVDNGFTAAVFVQEKTGKTIRRKLDSVHSSGTFLSCDTETMPRITNNICAVWMEVVNTTRREPKDAKLLTGVAIANIFTGTTYLCEWVQSFELQPTICDDLERVFTVHAPSEIILLSNLNNGTLDKLVQYAGIQTTTTTLHRVDIHTNHAAKNCSQQRYMRHVLSSKFGEMSVQMCQEFDLFPTATQAFCFLLDFVQEHNPNLVSNLQIPRFHNTTHDVLLANHTLRQLNIVDPADAQGVGHLRSVCSFLNRCGSAMGRRLFHATLVTPTTDETWLQREYEWIDRVLQCPDFITASRQQFSKLRDVERILRQWVARKLYPSTLVQLHHTMGLCHDMVSQACALFGPTLIDYLDMNTDEFLLQLNVFMQTLDATFFLERAAKAQSLTTFDDCFVRPGINAALDATHGQYETYNATFTAFYRCFNELLMGDGQGQDQVRIHETEKSGNSLQLTKKRRLVLERILTHDPTQVQVIAARYPLLHDVDWTSVRFKSGTNKQNDEIQCPRLDDINTAIKLQKDQLSTMLATTYMDILATLEERFSGILKTCARVVARLDVLVCKAFLAQEHHYCKPELVSGPSRVEAHKLRHVLIEHLQTHETYIANDMCLGSGSGSGESQTQGVLLFGTNAVGKTSLIRALGIAVILAQAGMFVPCSSFRFSPYRAIFSRILANDNLFKGLSTFAVEMSELRIILKMADAQSLILGDELCAGTEMESALSIFVAGLEHLSNKGASFVFATHFHEIVKYEEVRALTRVALKHLAVHYDRETDALIYDRKLRDGPGDKMYGLEVCKALHLPDDFLADAYKLRTKYFATARGELSHRVSSYNSDKVCGWCEECQQELSTEVHHVIPQRLADAQGFIETTDGVFHKNHRANLKALCEGCHAKAHHHG